MNNKFYDLPEWLCRGVADIFPVNQQIDSSSSLSQRLIQTKIGSSPLRVKLGIDPTGSEIHIGHSILFRKLRAFQDAGHTAILIIGDFTARIGDPTGKNKTRLQLSIEEVNEYSKNYLIQLGYGKSSENSLLDFKTPGRLEIHRNSSWLENLDLSEIINLMSNITVGQMLAKEDFNNRYVSGTAISLHEFLYPILQAYDSVAIKADIELGGTDQKFNIAMGRDLQRHLNQKPQFGLLLPILVGLDGNHKMSKSLGNVVNINDDPLTMYSKLEKINDNLVDQYILLLTQLNLASLPTDLREKQLKMALEVTSVFHGPDAAKQAQIDAKRLVSGFDCSAENIIEISLSKTNFPAKAFYLINNLGFTSTSSEARRQIKGGAVRLEGNKITDPNIIFDNPDDLVGKVLQIGKKTFRRLSE
tara:strand:- start:332 stop:1579 length:1248 start_codon:yes stop_codon:yes gene_type:complete